MGRTGTASRSTTIAIPTRSSTAGSNASATSSAAAPDSSPVPGPAELDARAGLGGGAALRGGVDRGLVSADRRGGWCGDRLKPVLTLLLVADDGQVVGRQVGRGDGDPAVAGDVVRATGVGHPRDRRAAGVGDVEGHRERAVRG